MEKIVVQTKNIVVQDFVIQTPGGEISASELLDALGVLVDSQLSEVYIGNSSIASYLKSQGLITDGSTEGYYKLNEQKRSDCISLGNEVSKGIDKQINSFTRSTQVRLPQIVITDEQINRVLESTKEKK